MTAFQRPRPALRLFTWLTPRSALILAGLLLAAAAPPPPDTAGMTGDRAAALLAQETALIAKGRLRDAQRTLARRVAAERSPRKRAELTEAFGMQIFAASPKLDDDSAALALDYLGRGVDAYRLVLGADHPEVATALVRRAEVERLLHPDDPAPWTDLAYDQAYRIRSRQVGDGSLLTLSTLIPMAEMKVLRAKGDTGEIEAAAGWLNQVVDGTASANGVEGDAAALHEQALARLRQLQRLYAVDAAGTRRPQIIAASGVTRCATADLDDTLIFSGEAAALEKLRGQFRRAKLDPRPCGSMLLLRLGPGVDPSPVVDLLTDISAGRIPGVRMGLSAGGATAAEPPPPSQP
jgi:hypothetical protein